MNPPLYECHICAHVYPAPEGEVERDEATGGVECPECGCATGFEVGAEEEG